MYNHKGILLEVVRSIVENSAFGSGSMIPSSDPIVGQYANNYKCAQRNDQRNHRQADQG